MTHDSGSDETQIHALIGAHFDALKWSPGFNPDWQTFSTDFLYVAQLFPAARPVQAKSLSEFIERHCQTKNLAISQSPGGCRKSQVLCAVHRQPGITNST